MTTVELPLVTVSTVTANGPVLAGRHTQVDATAAPVTVTLPSPPTPGARLSVEKVDTTINPVVVSGSIRGSAATVFLVTQYDVSTFLWTGSTWRVSGSSGVNGVGTTGGGTTGALGVIDNGNGSASIDPTGSTALVDNGNGSATLS